MILDLDHNTEMLSLAVGMVALKLRGDGRYLDRLTAAIDAGAAMRPNGICSRRLDRAAAELRALADAIDHCRTALVDNATPRLALVAAE